MFTTVVRWHKYELVILYVSCLKFTYLSKVKMFIFRLVKNPAACDQCCINIKTVQKKSAEYKRETNIFTCFLDSTQLSKLLSIYTLMVYKYFSRQSTSPFNSNKTKFTPNQCSFYACPHRLYRQSFTQAYDCQKSINTSSLKCLKSVDSVNCWRLTLYIQMLNFRHEI